MNVLPFKWKFRLKPLDKFGNNHFEKSRCVVRGDFQQAELDNDPYGTYAPVASHEEISILFAVAAAQGLIIEGGDVASAYLYGDIYCVFFMEQPTDSSGIPEKRGFVSKRNKSNYGLKQAGQIWGSLFIRKHLDWGFKPSAIDQRVLFK